MSVRVPGIEKDTTCAKNTRSLAAYEQARREKEPYGNLLRPTRLPTRKRRSNVANPILKIQDFQSASITTESHYEKRQAPT